MASVPLPTTTSPRRPQRPPRQVLLLIVFGVLLAVVGVTATSQAIMVGVYSSRSTLNAIVASDVATLRGFVYQGVDEKLIEQPVLPPAAHVVLAGLMDTLRSKGEILHVELRRPNGDVVAASDPDLSGTVQPQGAFLQAVTDGQVQIDVVDAAESGAVSGSETELNASSLIREYLPLLIAGKVVLVVGLWRDAGPILGGLDELRRDVVVVTITAALIASVTLYFVFRAAQGRLARQAQALLEASRRDSLTGLLGHGALVEHLAADIERARREARPIGVALIDIDGFRLLNESHGHDAGDVALGAVASKLEEWSHGQFVIGRFGPDEFLVISTAKDAEALQSELEEVRAALAELSLQFGSSERLPVTVSVGLCTYPTHAGSVTTLLSTAVQTLDEAKAGGGNSVRIAREGSDTDAAGAGSFDVLKGLVIAVDTKDRYTKRHSEDVARYASFLAGLLDLDDEMLRTINIAGLLHDVGKIGIPDEILRKPGRLTEAEEAVIRQHVALGDLIVRELPNVDTIRAGIRHHHERWDGRGYLHGLRGTDIPLVARILAVGDAFSAMTTTRPYRKALETIEALTRLNDAAGNQLDETLVAAFIAGIEHAPNPPLPGESQPIDLWRPVRRAA